VGDLIVDDLLLGDLTLLFGDVGFDWFFRFGLFSVTLIEIDPLSVEWKPWASGLLGDCYYSTLGYYCIKVYNRLSRALSYLSATNDSLALYVSVVTFGNGSIPNLTRSFFLCSTVYSGLYACAYYSMFSFYLSISSMGVLFKSINFLTTSAISSFLALAASKTGWPGLRLF
jgi:hypothetical protein